MSVRRSSSAALPWASPGLTDIHHQMHSAKVDANHGDHEAEEKARPRRSFTPEFKAEFVEHSRRGDRSIGQVARDLNLTETAVRAWVTQAEIDAGERPRLSSDDRAELARLLHENRRLRLDNETLKRATALLRGRSHAH
jgi:transposase